MDQDLRECLNRCLDELRTAIRDETARTCQHIDAFGERLKPGRFLRYLEARELRSPIGGKVLAGSLGWARPSDPWFTRCRE